MEPCDMARLWDVAAGEAVIDRIQEGFRVEVHHASRIHFSSPGKCSLKGNHQDVFWMCFFMPRSSIHFNLKSLNDTQRQAKITQRQNIIALLWPSLALACPVGPTNVALRPGGPANLRALQVLHVGKTQVKMAYPFQGSLWINHDHAINHFESLPILTHLPSLVHSVSLNQWMWILAAALGLSLVELSGVTLPVMFSKHQPEMKSSKQWHLNSQVTQWWGIRESLMEVRILTMNFGQSWCATPCHRLSQPQDFSVLSWKHCWEMLGSLGSPRWFHHAVCRSKTSTRWGKTSS